MQKSTIEWLRNPDGSKGYTSNPIKGLCPVACPYCYARSFYHRFKWNPEIRLDEKELLAPFKVKKPNRIFIGSTIEMYHPNIPLEWISNIIAKSYDAPWHTYFTLTKMPENLSSIEFPEWWWVGTTITGSESHSKQMKLIFNLLQVECSHRFISFEPLLGAINIDVLIQLATKCSSPFFSTSVDWTIIGAQTPNRISTNPQEGWIEQIIRHCEWGKISIFLKNNLKPIMGENLIQEIPK